MADNVAITAGAGTTVATDDVSGIHYQKMKLYTSEADSAEGIGDTDKGSTRAMWVDPRPMQTKLQVTPTVSTSPAYTAGDCVGGIQTLTAAARANGGSGIVQAIIVLDKTQAQRPTLELLFFDVSPTSAGDNAAVAFSDADMANCIGVVGVSAWNNAWPGTPLNSLSTMIGVGLPFKCASGDSNLYVQAVTRSTPTFVSTSDLIFTYQIFQD